MEKIFSTIVIVILVVTVRIFTIWA